MDLLKLVVILTINSVRRKALFITSSINKTGSVSGVKPSSTPMKNGENMISIAKAKLYLVMIVERFSVINLPFKGTSKLFINLVNVRYLSVRDVI